MQKLNDYENGGYIHQTNANLIPLFLIQNESISFPGLTQSRCTHIGVGNGSGIYWVK